jgi:hypothetical protein
MPFMNIFIIQYFRLNPQLNSDLLTYFTKAILLNYYSPCSCEKFT